jgi:hypothetical protein
MSTQNTEYRIQMNVRLNVIVGAGGGARPYCVPHTFDKMNARFSLKTERSLSVFCS